ncbi:MAG: PilZ domain-containing protein [Chromatiales bacterium]|nr:PilZ domain-containing protein [Chromatiales bacterium]
MLDYSEKRNFPRMSVDCAARFRVNGSDALNNAIVKDLSGGGMLLWTDDAVEAGSKLSIVVVPGKSITPPLHAELEVVRCAPLEMEAEASYSVACTITQLLKEEEVRESSP